MNKNIYPKVSIIILNWNGIDDTCECVESLKKVTYPNLSVIIVDQASNNNEADRLEKLFPDLKIIKNKINSGFTGGNNKGARYALKEGSDYILLLNNDTVVTETFVKPLIETFQRKKLVGCVSPLIASYNSDKIWFYRGGMNKITGIVQHFKKGKPINDFIRKGPIKTNFVSACCLITPAKVIQKYGLFEDKFFGYSEDLDFCIRLQRAGYILYTNTDSLIYHKKSASFGIKGSNKVSPLQARLQTRNYIWLVRKNFKGIYKVYLLSIALVIRSIFKVLGTKSFETIKALFTGVKQGFF